ncbi:hypothetical protein HPP92_010846 [Vanilla planifolia]|uniref:alanine--tRNA ligase n=1 Tax=Vanilla planifolia TaxID=51239 RepID=A0A835R4W6_VANPL|nr:hypothetical protein HPP92_010846 [Vanilla planifolia]
MLQFKPVFLGKEPRPARVATTAQRCIRTNDVENVGRTARHHTFFEMLGNFSFGDYFKKDAVLWAWELMTKEFDLPVERLWISIFKDDDEAFKIWHNEVKVPTQRLRGWVKMTTWTSGVTGPWVLDLGDDSRFIELYNLVFMQYNKKDDGSLEPLKHKNIDTEWVWSVWHRYFRRKDNGETTHAGTIKEGTQRLALKCIVVDANLRQRAKVWGCEVLRSQLLFGLSFYSSFTRKREGVEKVLVFDAKKELEEMLKRWKKSKRLQKLSIKNNHPGTSRSRK